MKNKFIKDHTKLICDIGEMTDLFADSSSLENFLQRIVEMIAKHMQSNVCSIYLYYEESQSLILKATTGLNAGFIGNLRLKLGEGLTGLALKELRPICERNASKNSNFRYFPGLGEERYESFLVVPILRGKHKIGAIVVQNKNKDYFTDEDIRIFKSITVQLANTIETTRMILSFEERSSIKEEKADFVSLTYLKGKSASSGMAFAPVFVLDDNKSLKDLLNTEDTGRYTIDDFNSAVIASERQLEDLQKQIENKLADGASLIFTAQILMLKDKAFIDRIMSLAKQQSVAQAIVDVVTQYVFDFNQMKSQYLREKSQDVRDIGVRILRNLFGSADSPALEEGHIVIAHELFPSDILKLSLQNTKGIILLHGGVTSHVSILAQSLQIPLVIADDRGLLSLPELSKILLSASTGEIFVNPGEVILQSYRSKQISPDVVQLEKDVKLQTISLDGVRVKLMANVNLLGDLVLARAFKAEGVGLYRTEFPFIVRSNFPSEEEQYVIYKKLIEGMPDKEITFRTLDIGGDKVLSFFEDHHKEKNPYLGMRSIRFSLQHTDIFDQQVRAILRAGIDVPLRIMFPMVTSVDEFLSAKKQVELSMAALKLERIKHNARPRIGMMIEVPSIMHILEELCEHADFFSIGTNDFVQYLLAVDRSNERVADLYLSHHPSVLRALKTIVDVTVRYQKDVSICGDMVHEEKYLNFLLGIGLRNISLGPMYIPGIQQAIEKISIKEAALKAEVILTKSKIDDIEALLG